MRKDIAGEKLVGGLEIMAGLTAVGALLLGFGILALHLIERVRFGYWPHYSVLDFLLDEKISPPTASARGAQRLLDWLMAQPIALMGPVVLIALSLLLNKLAKDERRAAAKHTRWSPPEN